MKKNVFYINTMFICLFLILINTGAFAEEVTFGEKQKQIEDFVSGIIGEAKIPGLTISIVWGDGSAYVKGFGYADLRRKIKVSPRTQFELGSCSKSFTALAAMHLEERGLINLDHPVSTYLPGFYLKYKNQNYDITLRQCLDQTSGIPANTIALIPEDSSQEALQNTVRRLVGIELDHIPGERFLYATMNYDVLGAVIEKVSGKPYEDYMLEYIFKPLGLGNSTVGVSSGTKLGSDQAKGYKIGFFAPREYKAPVYRGNNPAGYIISNGEDMARWLKIQMGIVETDLSKLIEKSHIPDQSVVPNRNLVYYFMGWMITKHKISLISHSGLNPNFTSYVGFRPDAKIGVAVLANSNSTYTSIIGDHILKIATNEKIEDIKPPETKIDAVCSIFTFMLGIILLLMFMYLISKIKGIIRGEKKFGPISSKKIGKMVFMLFVGMPLYIGIYIFPMIIVKITWEMIIVWGPASVSAALLFLIAFFSLSYIIYCLSLLFPDRNMYRNIIPLVLVLNTVSSLVGMAILPIYMTAFFSTIPVGYILYYFGLAISMNVSLNKIAQTKMIYFVNNVTLDVRVDLVGKILATKYQKFEKLLDGQIITTLSNDAGVLTGAAGLFMQFISNSVVVIAGLIYLSTISFIASSLVVISAIVLGIYYFWVSVKAKVYLEEARTAQNIYTSFLNSMINGYKELSMHFRKKNEFGEDMVNSCKKIRDTNIIAGLKFLNSDIIGGTIASIIIGLFCILTPRLLTDVNVFVLISLLMVILYIRGPIAVLIGTLPHFTGIRVSWGRIKKFNEDIDPLERVYTFKKFFKELDLPVKREISDKKILPYIYNNVENIKLEDVTFRYKDVNEEKHFEIGPISFEVKRGEILFITGGNGSGKTTLIKILAGLYETDAGSIKINGKEVSHAQLGEQYSAIFSDYHLFKRLYEIDVKSKESEINEYLKSLELVDKVHLEGNFFSTINLSGGQRKRLALIQCYLEDRTIFLFDELAANQDPGFREFIYKVLFPRMKEERKIVIACTHDDHYFGVADKVIKMDMGKIEREFQKESILTDFVSNSLINKYTQKE